MFNCAPAPSAFQELRYGYFAPAFANILKAIRGGTNPIGTMTLAMCTIGALSQIEWAIENQRELGATGELRPMTKKEHSALDNGDRKLFEGWLTRWIKDAGINSHCDPAKVYGVRCALVHTSGGAEALSKTGVGAWQLTADHPANHYEVVNERFTLDMPSFLAELMLAADGFLQSVKPKLDIASPELRLAIGFLAGLVSADNSGLITSRLVDLKLLAWFDKRLTASPLLEISVDELSQEIRESHNTAAKLILE